ncbi:serine/threonine protein kinase [Catenulispora acidiphila DSM 44928]|uniref:Serine/threonine protein kinase n=1 Tax=Catenulispora acidiphila (strain DSM 44928 / JCM 14897 / NBRC 102108 / NRRL B-24433 / ID139908) TaxID=479433 RepID=C7Q7D6_CATAD|nr:serine/threonine-protein kinase [Catenulispora acidiphila]ACU70224.1 serine/threonine protein kinase [Catenulispora acidiphila DSM 44928]
MAPLSGDDPRHLGGFRVLTLLAVGGMGRVYLALGPDRQAVALKVARPEFAADARFRTRFRREVQTAREIGRDPVGGGALIAPVVAADADADLPWLASEYVPGPSVTDAAMAFGPLTDAGLRTLTHGLALALTEVHAAGVVHRDVKPSNVLLARDGPRLIDFGVARAIDDIGLTRVGALIGSPGFLSPEQAVGEPATFASDVFALASVVAYAARGQSPFGAGDGAALLYRVVHEPPKLEGLPADLAEVLAASLAKDPGERPSAPEIAALVAPEELWLSEAVLEDIARREAELAAWLQVTAADPLWVKAVSAAFDTVAESALDIANAAVTEPSRGGTRRRGAGRAGARSGAGDVVPPTGWAPRTSGRAGAGDVVPDRAPAGRVPRISGRAGAGARSGAGDAGVSDHASPQPDAADTVPPLDTQQAPAGAVGDRADSPTHGIRSPGLPRFATPEPAPDSATDPAGESDADNRPGAAYAAFLLDPDPPLPAPIPAATHHRAAPRPRFPLYAALGALVGAAATAGILLLPHAGHHAPAPSRGPASASTSGNQKAAPSTPAGGRSGSAKP